MTPAELLDRRRQLTMSGDVDGLADLFATDAVIEWPFLGTPGAPARLQGRDAIREHSHQVAQAPVRLERYEVTQLHRTADPEVVVVEMEADATITTTGQTIAATSIQVLRIRDGHIVLFRDYADPRALEEASAAP